MEPYDLQHSRYIPINLWYPHRSKSKRGPNGRPLCRKCGQPVPKRRRVWCSDECELEALVVCGYSGAIKGMLMQRDKGVCQACGLQAKFLLDIHRYWYMDEFKNHFPEIVHANLRAAGYDTGLSLWQAHHIIPVEAGGARLGSSNLITLCQLCHKRAHNLARPNTRKFLIAHYPLIIQYLAPDFSGEFPFTTHV